MKLTPDEMQVEIRAQLRALGLDRIRELDELERVRWRIRNIDRQIEDLKAMVKESTDGSK